MNNLFTRYRFSRELKRLAKENAAAGKPLSVLDDIVFKAMLGANSEDSNEALRSLLSACTRREVRKVQVLNNDLVPAHFDAKTARLDVHVTFNDGEAADLEMQAGMSDDDLKARAEYYTSALLAGQQSRGKQYRDIKRVYQIFFLNCVLFPQSSKLSRRYYYQEEEEHDRLSEATEIIFYELPKLEARLKNFLKGSTETLREEEKWCMFIKYRHEERAAELIDELCRKEAGIMRAEQAVTKVSRDYIRFAKKLAGIKNSMDRAQRLYEAEQEGMARGMEKGIAEGMEKGIEKGMAEAMEKVARNALAQGLAPDFVQKITGLDIQTISGLQGETGLARQ
ncbi:MAG: Rpn family recombination-promoting nuclease/putative transposase [Treponema sp.]|jgi:predicted transposase/invertase (TIGR01784 family)|nr:Rpn family recombination-promoting nuclease/putative transposase [Treponema sp.]